MPPDGRSRPAPPPQTIGVRRARYQPALERQQRRCERSNQTSAPEGGRRRICMVGLLPWRWDTCARTPPPHHLISKATTQSGAAPARPRLRGKRCGPAPSCRRISDVARLQSAAITARRSRTQAAATSAAVNCVPHAAREQRRVHAADSVASRKACQRCTCCRRCGCQASMSPWSQTRGDGGGPGPPSMRTHRSVAHLMAGCTAGHSSSAWSSVSRAPAGDPGPACGPGRHAAFPQHAAVMMPGMSDGQKGTLAALQGRAACISAQAKARWCRRRSRAWTSDHAARHAGPPAVVRDSGSRPSSTRRRSSSSSWRCAARCAGGALGCEGSIHGWRYRLPSSASVGGGLLWPRLTGAPAAAAPAAASLDAAATLA